MFKIIIERNSTNSVFNVKNNLTGRIREMRESEIISEIDKGFKYQTQCGTTVKKYGKSDIRSTSNGRKLDNIGELKINPYL